MNRTYIDVPLEIIEAAEADVDELSSDHDLDVLNIRFKLVYAGVNNNGDRFTDDILRANYQTLVHKLINWEHGEPNIGVITKARLVEPTKTNPLHVECDGHIMRVKYPEYAEMVANSAGIGAMGLTEANDSQIAKMSMEAYFHEADYVIGDYEQVIPMQDDRTGMLAQLLGKTIGGKLVSRELKDCTFTGAAVTVNPAEKRAVLMAAASNKTHDGDERYEELRDVEFAFASRRVFPIDTKARTLASYEYFDEVARLIDKEYETAPELVEAHRIIQDRLSDIGLSNIVHNCRICSEGGIEDMGRKTKNVEASEEVLESSEELSEDAEKEEVTEPEVAETVAQDDAEVESDSAVIAEPQAFDEPSAEAEEDVSDSVDEAEPVAEAEPELEASEDSETGDLSGNIDSVTSILTEIRDLLDALNTKEAKASETDEVSDIKSELEEYKSRAESAEADLLGMKRAISLASAGLTTLSALEDKASRYGAMDNITWTSYVEDLRTIKASAKDEVEETKKTGVAKASSKKVEEDDVAPILESVEEPDPLTNYKAYVMAIKRNFV